MAKAPLDTQTRYIWAILGRKNSPLSKDFKEYYNALENWLKYDSELYAFIGHDKDIDDDGLLKFRHIHLLIVLKEGKKPRLMTSLNKISKVCDLPPQDIDIEVADNVEQCIRYCVHKGYENKYQYPVQDLVSSLDDNELQAILNCEHESITASYLITAVKVNGCSSINIMKALGLKSYMKYRNAIRDIIEELKEVQD